MGFYCWKDGKKRENEKEVKLLNRTQCNSE